MSRSTKWKLAIIAGISECLVYAEAKYCAFQVDGEPKYYVCPRTEYCCNFGCCVSPGYQIYHLWYYWLLVIIMFLVCSGGGWWYRYWLQGRYRAAASAIPTRSSSSRSQNALRGPTCQAQQARISYNTARNTVLLHRMWKGSHRSATSPAYNPAGAASSAAAHYQNTSVVLNDANCPYYQLYGPPPSYETVIAQTRAGKISSPSSPELLRPVGLTSPQPPPVTVPIQQQRSILQAPTAPGTDVPFLGPCFYRPLPAVEAPQYQPPRFDGFDTSEYIRLMQQYNGAAPSIVQSPRHQLLHQHQHQLATYDRSSIVNTSKSSDNSEGENTVTNCSLVESPDEGGFARIDCLGSPCALDRSLQCYIAADKSTSRASIHAVSRRDRSTPSSSQTELTNEPIATTSSSSHGFESCTHRSRSELRKIQGGSLRIPRRREHQSRLQQQQQQQKQHQHETTRSKRRLSSTDYESSVTYKNESQSNPSSNVILAANANSKSTEHDQITPDDLHCIRLEQQLDDESTIVERSSTNTNLESKRKLDRSRSLD